MTQTAADTAHRLRLSPHTTFLLIVAGLLAAVSGLTWATHEVYEGVTGGNGIAALDHPALQLALDNRSNLSTTLAVVFTQLAGRVGNPVLALLALGLLTWRRRDWTPAVLLLSGMLGSLALTVLGKNIAGRVRPPRQFALPPFETSPSFPSGHTLNATVLAAVVCYLVLSTVRTARVRAAAVVVCVAFPLCVGASRMYLGQHWLTDVLAGLLLGLAWALSVVTAHRVWLQLRHRQR